MALQSFEFTADGNWQLLTTAASINLGDKEILVIGCRTAAGAYTVASSPPTNGLAIAQDGERVIYLKDISDKATLNANLKVKGTASTTIFSGWAI